jgi:hypothetical protein
VPTKRGGTGRTRARKRTAPKVVSRKRTTGRGTDGQILEALRRLVNEHESKVGELRAEVVILRGQVDALNVVVAGLQGQIGEGR